MAWEWVGPVSTAVVGVAGVAGTYWSARMGRTAAAEQAHEQREHALKERTHVEKRAAYVGYLEAVSTAQKAVNTIRRTPRSSETRAERRDLRVSAIAELSLRRAHLRLSAPVEVREHARRVHQRMAEALSAAVEGKPLNRDSRYEAALLASMKVDLGYELAPADHEALSIVAQLVADSARTEDEG